MTSKVEGNREKTGGRQKGTPNKVTGEVKGMILEALNNVGGVEYLTERARENPVAFLSLLGRIMPMQVNGAGENGEHLISGITVTLVKADAG